MRIALNDLRLDHVWLVYPGKSGYPIDSSISVIPLAEVPELLR